MKHFNLFKLYFNMYLHFDAFILTYIYIHYFQVINYLKQ